MSNPEVDDMTEQAALESSTVSLRAAGRRVCAVACVLSLAFLFGCDKNPNAPSSGDPGEVFQPFEPVATLVDVLIFPSNADRFFPRYKFTEAGADPGCSENHWHSSGPVHALGFIRADGELVVYDRRAPENRNHNVWADPDPTGCGHGRFSEVRGVRLAVVDNLLTAYYDVAGGPVS